MSKFNILSGVVIMTTILTYNIIENVLISPLINVAPEKISDHRLEIQTKLDQFHSELLDYHQTKYEHLGEINLVDFDVENVNQNLK